MLGGAALVLGAEEFRAIRDRLYRVSGIDMQAGKEGLVQTRLSKRVRTLGLASFGEYLDRVEADRSGQEFAHMLDLLTTNKTSFFRESSHFDLLRESILPDLWETGAPIRIWSAGCSSGEEPYTLATVIEDVERVHGPRDVRILATDLSTRVLARARAAVYDEGLMDGVSPPMRRRMFEPAPGEPGRVRVREALRARVRLARLNLMEPWPMRGPFDAILCRNVMIYFDRPTQERLVQRFHSLLSPGGHLFVGHSESLTGLDHAYTYVAPAAYVK